MGRVISFISSLLLSLLYLVLISITFGVPFAIVYLTKNDYVTASFAGLTFVLLLLIYKIYRKPIQTVYVLKAYSDRGSEPTLYIYKKEKNAENQKEELKENENYYDVRVYSYTLEETREN